MDQFFPLLDLPDAEVLIINHILPHIKLNDLISLGSACSTLFRLVLTKFSMVKSYDQNQMVDLAYRDVRWFGLLKSVLQQAHSDCCLDVVTLFRIRNCCIQRTFKIKARTRNNKRRQQILIQDMLSYVERIINCYPDDSTGWLRYSSVPRTKDLLNMLRTGAKSGYSCIQNIKNKQLMDKIGNFIHKNVLWIAEFLVRCQPVPLWSWIHGYTEWHAGKKKDKEDIFGANLHICTLCDLLKIFVAIKTKRAETDTKMLPAWLMQDQFRFIFGGSHGYLLLSVKDYEHLYPNAYNSANFLRAYGYFGTLKKFETKSHQ